MNQNFDVGLRFETLRQNALLHLYALVDGAQYRTQRDQPIPLDGSLVALFDGTPDAALAHAGPWLVDTALAPQTLITDLVQLEQESPAVTWIIAQQDLHGLAQLLQLHLNIQLPDGRQALLRFWDPRVLVNLTEVLDGAQRESLFGMIHEWHLLRDGRRAYIGRHHAHAE